MRARYVASLDAPPIENGVVHVRHGVIAGVGPARESRRSEVEDLGDVVLLPGFVNAHTHLELSHLAGKVSVEGGFVPWIERLVQAMKICGDAPPIIRASIRMGVRRSLEAGVTAAGDVARLPGLTRPLLRDGPLRVVSFGEVIALGGLRKELRARLEAAAAPDCASAFLRVGLSPHSPYLLEPEGIRTCAERAEADALPLCMHLAETPDEERFTRELAGPLRDYIERLGLWDDEVPCPGQRPVELAAACKVVRSDTILAHANYVTDSEMETIARSGAHVAYCPRTHHAFGHPPHRFRDMIAVGINVCVGTDSLASNPSLSVLDELRFLHTVNPDVPPDVLLTMGTHNGAKALGLADRIGSVTPHKDADLTAVPYDPAGPADPLANALESRSPPVATYVRGRRVVPV